MSEQVELEVASKESVALALAKEIKYREDPDNKKGDFRKNYLDLYAECLEATKGNRSI